MTEPDFDQIVRELRKYFMDDGPDQEATQNALLDQIVRQVWNARGDADVKLFEDDQDHRDILESISTLDR